MEIPEVTGYDILNVGALLDNCRLFVKLLSCLEIFQFLLNKLMERCCSLDWEFPVFVEHIL